MNRKGSNLLNENIMYLLITLIFVSFVFGFLWNKSNNAGLWSDFYAKELARVANSAEPGDSISLDVHKGTVIAKRNGLDIQVAENMFIFDSKNNRICVQLSKIADKCYPYFNEVAFEDVDIALGVPINILSFKVVDKNEVDNE